MDGWMDIKKKEAQLGRHAVTSQRAYFPVWVGSKEWKKTCFRYGLYWRMFVWYGQGERERERGNCATSIHVM